MACASVFGLALHLGGEARAYWLPSPTLVWPTSVNSQSYTGSPRPVQNIARFSGAYRDPSLDEDVPFPDGGDFPTNVFMSRSGGYSGDLVSNWADMGSDPSTFRTFNANYAGSSTPDDRSFMNTTAGVTKWYVVSGPPGSVSLRMDVAIQGHLSARTAVDANARAHTTHVLTFIASPAATLRELVLVMNGAALPPGEVCGGFGRVGTVPDQCFLADGERHVVNYAVRSNPFVVQTGTPFFLAHTASAHAGVDAAPSEPVEAESVWDVRPATSASFPGVPELTAEGFVVDLDGDPATPDVTTLAAAGYAIDAYNLPTVDSVAPTVAGSARPVTLTISGTGFAENAVAKLVRAGEADVVGETRSLAGGGRTLRATFDLAARSPGAWDVVVVNYPADPLETTAVLPGGFTNENGGEPGPSLTIVGRSIIRFGRSYAFDVWITNRGRVDAVGAVVVDGIPRDASWSVEPLPEWRRPVVADRTKRGLALLLPTVVVSPGQAVRVPLRLTVPFSRDDFFQFHLVWEE